ncbi:MAG: putative sulfate exporter family transporter [Pseudomonadota bacterium]|nr:putative sulfate exporter family transporter [Pseudomonadota bacterium]
MSKTQQARLGAALALAVGLYFRNPAYALLLGLATRLLTGVNPLHSVAKWGKLSLQAAIVLLGFTLGFDRMLQVSADYGLVVAVFVLGTLALGFLLAKALASETGEATLLSSGTAICGGTAIATLAPIIQAKPHNVGVAMALVFLLNAVALLTFPYIGQVLELSQQDFGAWVALAIHDTSSVVATAAIYGDEAAVVATTVKLGRTLWLIPLAFAVSLIYRSSEARLRVPGFILLFILAAGLGSVVPMGDDLLTGISVVSKTLLVVALGMIGLEIDRSTLSEVSWRSVALGVGLWALVAPIALALVLWT